MKHKSKILLVLAGIFAVLAIILYNCGGGGGGGGYGGGGGGYVPPMGTVQLVSCSSVTPAVTVSATDALVFSPSAVHVPIDGVVMWTNTGTMLHSVTSGSPPGTPNGMFDQMLSAATSVCLKFTTAGTYNYYCRYHYTSGMTGSVTVP